MTVSHRNHRCASRQWAILLALSGVAAAQEAAAPDGGGPAAERIYDRAVASVEGRVITMSQLELEARVLLVNAGGVDAAFAPLDRDVLSRSLSLVIDQRLAVLEADKLDTWPLEPGELEQAVRAFSDRFPSDAKFREFLEVNEAEVSDVAQVLRRSIRAQRALDGKLRLKAQVAESEARRAQAERADLKALPLELVRQKLFAERFTALVKAELRATRRTADVRLLGPWAAGAQP